MLREPRAHFEFAGQEQASLGPRRPMMDQIQICAEMTGASIQSHRPRFNLVALPPPLARHQRFPGPACLPEPASPARLLSPAALAAAWLWPLFTTTSFQCHLQPRCGQSYTGEAERSVVWGADKGFVLI